MSDDDLNGLSEDEFELVEHPHEEVTHVDRPRYTSPVSDVEEAENPPLTTDALANLVGPAAGLNGRSQGRAPVRTYGSMRSCFGVLVLMAILRLIGASAQSPRPAILPFAPQRTMWATLEWGGGADRPSWRGLGL